MRLLDEGQEKLTSVAGLGQCGGGRTHRPALPGCPPPRHLPSSCCCRDQLHGLRGGWKPVSHALTMEICKTDVLEPSVFKCCLDGSDISYSSAIMKSIQQILVICLACRRGWEFKMDKK